MNQSTEIVEIPGSIPEVGTPISIPWACPEWCQIDHETDGYTPHGHIVHRASCELADGHKAEFWWSPIATWRRDPRAVVEVHLPSQRWLFSTAEDMQAYAEELTWLAGVLAERNAEVAA